MLRTKSQPVVIHSMERFCPITNTWLYNLVRTQSSYQPVVICNELENQDLFPFPDVRSPKETLRGMADILNKALMKGMRLNYSPFAYLCAKRCRPSLWHSHFGTRAVFDMELVRRLHIPQIVTFYGLDASLIPKRQPVWRDHYQVLFSRVAKVLAEGNHFKKVLVDLGCPSQKVTVQRIGIDEESIRFEPRRFTHGDTLKIMTVGTFREKKGIPYAIAALAEAKREYKNIQLTLYGDANKGFKRDQQEKKRILKNVEEYGLQDSVAFRGYVPFDQIFAECYSHHLLLQPSLTAKDGDTEGGFPVIISEMLASGMPVVSTFHCDIPEVVLDKQCGLLSPEREASTLAENIIFFVKNPDSLEAFAKAGRKHIEQNYSLKKQARALEQIYHEVLAEYTS